MCEKCGAEVIGDGFTNHCPHCLWGKHVDVNPGDRSEICRGLMEPIALALTRNGYQITHRCVRCGQERKNKASAKDAVEILLNR